MTKTATAANFANPHMSDFTMQHHIDSFLFNLQYQPQKHENIAPKIIGQAFTQLLECGINPEDYKKFCNQVFNNAGIFHEEKIIKKIFADFRIFFLNHAPTDLQESILQEWGANRDKLTDLLILQRSAAYIMRVMRQYSYRDNQHTRYKSLAISGPRPEKLPQNLDMFVLEQALNCEIENAIKGGFELFYSPMSQGVGMLAAQCVLELRKTHPSIQLVCINYNQGRTNKWLKKDRDCYFNILNDADIVVGSDTHFHPWSFFYTDRYLVDNCSLLLSVYGGENDADVEFTANYACKTGVDRINIDINRF